MMQVNSTSGILDGQQPILPFQLQQRQEASLDDRHKTHASLVMEMKAVVPAPGKPPASTVGESSNIQKVCLLLGHGCILPFLSLISISDI